MNERDGGSDDGELIRLCLAGDSSAFDALVARHHRGVYNVTYRMLGNAEDASDLTQETFLRVYTRLDTFKSGNPFIAWVRRIATNLCIDHLRRRGRPESSLDQQIEAGVQHADATPGGLPAEAVETAEDTRRVLEAMQQLPEKQRAVLVLRHIEGLKLEEIARTLRMPLGTVKTMLFRGRAAVRETVGEL